MPLICCVLYSSLSTLQSSCIMQSLLQQWFQESRSQFLDQDFNFQDSSGNSVRSLPYQLWNVSKYGVCADAAITGVMPPPLMEIQVVTLSSPYVC